MDLTNQIQKPETYPSSINQNSSQTQTTPKCKLCEGIGYIYNPETNSARPCPCLEENYYRRKNEKAGFSKLQLEKTFDNYITEGKPPDVIRAKNLGINYVKTFSGTESLALLGESGSGKTHLSIAICKELLKNHICVLYMQYRDVMTNLKQQIVTKDDSGESVYQKEIKKYTAAPVLYIDDLFKGKTSDSDVNIMFELINYRYINNLPILISSELSCEQLLQIDKAIGGRILEMCRGRIIEFSGISLNHRLI